MMIQSVYSNTFGNVWIVTLYHYHLHRHYRRHRHHRCRHHYHHHHPVLLLLPSSSSPCTLSFPSLSFHSPLRDALHTIFIKMVTYPPHSTRSHVHALYTCLH